MLPTRGGAFRIFRLAGVDVSLHWSWFLVAALEISGRSRSYSSVAWNALEYLTLFGIVTMHEFGHALACRSVGGQANQIVLWPLGGVAYVNPPPRPGATLWSIAAGPLVNVVLLPILVLAYLGVRAAGDAVSPDLRHFAFMIAAINAVLLAFNLLPVYPLDGGQILRSLLWFWLGPAKSLMVTAIIGFVGVAGLAAWAFVERSQWMMIMTAFIGVRCWSGFQLARSMMKLAAAPRRAEYACPACRASPPAGNFWGCGKCRIFFDTFETRGSCPKCGVQFAETRCVDCGAGHPFEQWSPGGTT